MSGTLELGSDWQVIGNDNGDTVVKHIPSGTTHTLGSDGTLTTDAVDTETERINAAGRGTTTQWGPRAMDAKGTPQFPTDWNKSSDNPIIQPVSGTDNQAAYPSIFHAGRYLSSPIDDWYCYWAGHDSGGIHLSTASDLIGPWSHYGQVVAATDTSLDQQISSPDPIWDDASGSLRLYLHGEDTSTAVITQPTILMTASTNDGTSFSEEGRCLDPQLDGQWDDREKSYAKVYRVGNNWVAFYDGRDRDTNNKGLGYAWSSDGSAGSWKTLPYPLLDNSHLQAYDGFSYDATIGQQGPTPSLIEWGGEFWLLMSVGSTSSLEIVAVQFGGVDQSTAEPRLILDATESWEAGSIESPYAYLHGDRLYMFYNSLDSSTSPTTREIGVAYTELSNYV